MVLDLEDIAAMPKGPSVARGMGVGMKIGDDQRAAGPGHAGKFGEGPVQLGDMADDQPAPH